MTALSANKDRVRGSGDPLASYLPAAPVAAATRLYASAAVGVNLSGYVVPMSAAPNLRCLGVTEEEVNNSAGSAGDLSATRIRRGPWRFSNNISTEALTAADVGRICYALDDDTATRTSGGGTRSALGRVLEVTSTYVLVEAGTDGDANGDCDIMLLANADLSAKQYHAVDVVDSSSTPKFAAVSSAGARVSGFLQNAPAAGAMAIVRPVGCGRQTRAIAGGALSVGATVASKNDGRLKAAVTGRTDTSDGGGANDPLLGSFAAGVLLTESASDGDAVNLLLCISGAVPQTAQ